MTIFGSIADAIDSGLMWLGSVMKTETQDYCDLETANDEWTLVAKDGSLMSVVRIDGVKSLIGGANFLDKIVIPIDGALSQPLNKKMHSVQFYFLQDPDRTEHHIREHLNPSFETMDRLEMDMKDMLEERVRNIAGWTNYEACYVALWTRPKGLTKAEQENQAKKNTKRNENLKIDTTRVQNFNKAYSILVDRHTSFVTAVKDSFARVGLAVDLLTAVEACREMRISINPSWTSNDWRPLLPGDKVRPQLRKTYLEEEEWDIVWPKLGPQLLPRDMTIVDDNVVRVGELGFVPVFVDLFQRDLKTFSDLFGRLMNANLPWRMSFMIDGDGLDGASLKKTSASLLGWTNSDNKLIKNGFEALEQMKQSAETIVKIRACFTTWGPISDMNEINRRASDLARNIENWGGCEVAERTGDPVSGLISSSLGLTYGSIGTPTMAPLKEVVSMMPLARPSSPWSHGAVTFRSPDGKVLPYQPGSKEQVTWISLIFAKPGSGKSVLMNMTNLALCLAAGIRRLPRIAIIDIGPSSSGLISLIKEALPESKKYLVAYHRLRMTREYAINPFDTQPGCRYPSSLERQFLINFLTLLVTDVNTKKPYTGMSGLVTVVLDDMYKRCSDKGASPHKYTPGIEYEVDEKLNLEGFEVDRNTIWWEVVDFLFERGYKKESAIAQRQAVPVLSEAALSAQDEKIKTQYGEIYIESKESLVGAFSRMISEALSLFPILARPTAFDLGDARVVSLDLDEVAKKGGAVADRQTEVMYMLARYVLAKDYYLNDEAISEVPYPSNMEIPKNIPADLYRQDYLRRFDEIKEDYKRICFDEFHRTSSSTAVRDQVLIDMREGRKWGVDVTLSSQALEDFDEQMLEFATGIFVMDGGNAQSIEKISKVFGFDDPAERGALQHGVHGPRRGGGTFMAKFNTKKGWYTMLLTSTLGPIELWALNTTAQDVLLRKKLYQKIGPKKARQVLALRFPGGSAVDEIEHRKNNLKQAGQSVDSDGSNIIENLSDELVALAKQRLL